MTAIHFSATTKGFYPAGRRKVYEAAESWPADAVLITSYEYETYGKGHPPAGMQLSADVEGRPCWVDLPAASLEDLATAALARINAGYSAAMAQTLAEYPDAETLSFDKQEAQADLWWSWYDPAGNNQAGAEPVTPYLDSMLLTRPIGKPELVTRIRDKAAIFSDAHGRATGKRQALEDEVKAALAVGDRERLRTLDWRTD